WPAVVAPVGAGVVSSLFHGPDPSDERRATIASGLGLDVDAPLLVVAATGDEVRALRVLISDHVRAGGTMFTQHLGEVLIAFTRSSDAPGHPDESLERGIADARVGVVHAPGIGSLPRSALSARELPEDLTRDEHTGP